MKFIVVEKKWIYYIVCALLCALLCVFLLFLAINKLIYIRSEPSEPCLMPVTTKVIVIDPGHGGVDPGAIGKSGIKEKNINLSISQYLKEYLEQDGGVVIMTRNDDYGLYSEGGSIRQKKNEDLRNRRAVVTNAQPDIFVTIHLNSFPQTKYYGAQTFYPKGSTTGKDLAEKIQEELKNVLDQGNKRVALEKEGVYIIKGLDIPTALVECGFLSNPNEEKLLGTSEYQQKVAFAIYMGIQKYFENNP
ncbi:N-acetylmuramoyl-L-alanine amidase CwlD [Serpentinicella sp. ANB-PHB4]|uniref:N-acetylmuramoyl-L-alanine amidase CwlD n=1 Tax=Serpentinicella sp. ANB-PHB4 TaxID=3074076 RepID=UPI002862DF3C|nr:N-acetylmuramoyl-L-alanine amidase CwlD [Serpentinicella sp. ANB-PHB4]MDR5659515.1 N-acetylmuramoyl-L-alanine amidase CwlD [Serpentinicella sp. ANB-PHB4]